MLAAITAYANTIPVTTVDPTLVVSKALMLQQGIIASGGSRYDADTIAKYEFKEGTGSVAYDTSGVSPEADLTVSGNTTWDQAWGVIFGAGQPRAGADHHQPEDHQPRCRRPVSTRSRCGPRRPTSTQTAANIVSYSGSDTDAQRHAGTGCLAVRGLDPQQQDGHQRRHAASDHTSTAPSPRRRCSTSCSPTIPVNGQKLYVNGEFTGDVDPNGGGSLANWDNTFALVLGNETTGDKQWLGEIRFLAIHDRALTAAQVLQNFNAGVGQKYFLLFDVSSIVRYPAVVHHDDGHAVRQLQLSLLRSDVHQPRPPTRSRTTSRSRASASASTARSRRSDSRSRRVSTTIGGSAYTAANGQLLSSVGSVIGVDIGMKSDMFFLSFDQLGNQTHVYVEPAVPPNPTATNDAPQPDFGVHTFAEVNAAMSVATGVPVSDSVVAALYTAVEQSMPAVPQITAFTASEQTAISQLAGAYCSELVNNQQYRRRILRHRARRQPRLAHPRRSSAPPVPARIRTW